MSFQPNVGDVLSLDEVEYRIAEHPGAPGIAYGQEGRQGIVYKLAAAPVGEAPVGEAPSPAPGEGRGGGDRALKVFKPRYRLPGLVALADHIGSFATLSGLEVCRRSVLTPRRQGSLLHEHPDLVYAVVMPWIAGPTWMEVMLDKRELSAEQSLELARALVEVLVALEQRSMAHCDLSGPNVLLPGLVGDGARSSVALVDVEQMYAPGLEKPELLPGGSLGYAQHRTATEGLWESKADRYAGAVLVAEMLGWCDERVRQAAWGENYFDPQEMQTESERAQALGAVLRERWGTGAAGLFERAWRSETLGDCATFGEWSVILPQAPPAPASAPASTVQPTQAAAGAEAHTPPSGGDDTVQALLGAARRLEQQRDVVAALEVYRQVQALIPAGSGLAQELGLIVPQLEAQASARAAARPSSRAPAPFQAASPEVELADLFEDGREAYQRGEWAKARELLGEVVRREPGYVRGKQRADRLLGQAEKRLAPRRGFRLPSFRRYWRVAVLVLVGAIALPAILFGSVSLGSQLGSLLSPPPAATPVPQPKPTAAVVANPAAKPPAAPTLPPTPTPTVDQVWQATLTEVEAPWGSDWPRAIALVDAFRQRFAGYRPADDKLYAALLGYAEQLSQNGQRERAVDQLLRAQALLPTRGEAPTALRALAAVPTAEPAAEPAPEPAPGPAQPAPGPQVAPPAAPQQPRPPAPQPPASAPTPRPLRP
jgi:tetratricopeptide (TPR) repeat protein